MVSAKANKAGDAQLHNTKNSQGMWFENHYNVSL